MPEPRVIPSLLISDRKLVKTKQYKNPKYIGDPLNAIRIFNEKKVDELFIFDIDKSRHDNRIDFDYVGKLAEECFFPLCYGGGVKTLEDARMLFSLGVEKIALQSSVLDNVGLISQIAEVFGSQSIVISLDIKRSIFGSCQIINSSTKKISNLNPIKFINDIERAGAGELLLSFTEREGTFRGPDLENFVKLSNDVDIPVVLSGGISSSDEAILAIKAGASGVAIGSRFVFYGPHNAVLISYFDDEKLKEIHETF